MKTLSVRKIKRVGLVTVILLFSRTLVGAEGNSCLQESREALISPSPLSGSVEVSGVVAVDDLMRSDSFLLPPFTFDEDYSELPSTHGGKEEREILSEFSLTQDPQASQSHLCRVIEEAVENYRRGKISLKDQKEARKAAFTALSRAFKTEVNKKKVGRAKKNCPYCEISFVYWTPLGTHKKSRSDCPLRRHSFEDKNDFS
jgi:hypothetical protein